jgi:ubiquinone/menaquinone biosynthesis C-methylase UbiE
MKRLFYFIIMKNNSFDPYASKYDAWSLKNKHVLYSELKLVAHFMTDGGDIFSVGCGSGLFEMFLEKEFNISVKQGIEPSAGMAEIARKRGMKVAIPTDEETDFGKEVYNTVLFNEIPSYTTDLQKAVDKAYRALYSTGKIVIIDVPKESSCALLYNLVKAVGIWAIPCLKASIRRNIILLNL